MLAQLIIKKGKERALYNRHPWVFSGAAENIPFVENGEIIEIRSYDQKLLGYGFYAPATQIVCRVFEYTDKETDVLSEAYWHQKIQAAYDIRQKYVASEHTDSYRLINSEGDFFPGIIADVYNDTVVLQLLIKGTERIKAHIISALKKLQYKYIYLKGKDVSERLENVNSGTGWLSEEAGNVEITIRENDVLFNVNIETGQKTGFFLDQRDSRKLIQHFSKDAKVLNTFSYSGGFSMYALKAGAELVHSVDSSKIAIELCNDNAKLNGFTEEQHQGFTEDVFAFLKTSQTAYDVIVLDPPAFAKTAKAVANAARGYKELNLLAFKKIKPGGIVFTFSCSQKIDRDLFRKIVFGAAADARRNVRILHQTTQPEDHPINIYHPENEYLKGLVLIVE